MANPDEELTVAQRLGRALDRGLLPAGGPAEAAERLIERLERPARIALLGLPGSGKSSILNLLVGTIVVPETLRLPTIVVQHGDSARMICTLTDGSTKILGGSDLAEVLPLAPALVTLEMNLPALKVISLLEVSVGPMEAEQKRAANWASKRADIVIWCTTSYLPKEQLVWESLPDSVKDNSFMFLTKVDLLGSRQSAAAMHERVELRAGEEFRQILSISAKEARAAVPPGGPVNRELFRDSGAAAVIAAIKTRVQSGRRADMDTAELLLARHVEAGELVARRFAEPGEPEAAEGWTPPPLPEEFGSTVEAETESESEAELPEAEAAVEEEWTEPVEAEAEEEEAAVAEPEPEPEAEPEPEPEPMVEVSLDPEPEPVQPAPSPVVEEPKQETRRRFADRIKRVAGEGDPVAAPLVPLRTTWKSKSEMGAAPEPAPEPAPRPTEPVRRPRPTSQQVAPEAPAVVPPDESDLPDLSEAAEEVPPPDVVAEEPVRPRDRVARAITPRPERAIEVPAAEDPEPGRREPSDAEPEAPGTERRKLFGAARPAPAGLTRGSPLPDLSALRARPEELEGDGNPDLPDLEDVDEDDVPEIAEDLIADAEDLAEDTAEAAELDIVEELEPEPEPDLAPEPEPAPRPEPTPAPSAPVERPSLFKRDPRPRPAEPAAPPREERAPPMERRPREAPIQRLPAAARAAAAPAAPAAPAMDEAMFSPMAIMRRDQQAATDQPAPRRERPRIAARAVPTSPAPAAAPAVDIGQDGGLADEAIAMIKARAAALESEIDFDAKVPVDLILEHTRETGEQVMAVVSRGRSDAMRRINSDLGEVLDHIMLMQLEKGHAPADDALTMILQLRRELETLRAV